MNRRDALTGTSTLLMAALATQAAAQGMQHDHSHMHMHMHDSPLKKLIAATSDCSAKGQACLAHCLVLLADGDKVMAECAKSVNQTIALCNALESLAAQQAPLVRALAKVTLDACEACEKECRKHEKHQQCKDCAESCVECIKACKAALA